MRDWDVGDVSWPEPPGVKVQEAAKPWRMWPRLRPTHTSHNSVKRIHIRSGQKNCCFLSKNQRSLLKKLYRKARRRKRASAKCKAENETKIPLQTKFIRVLKRHWAAKMRRIQRMSYFRLSFTVRKVLVRPIDWYIVSGLIASATFWVYLPSFYESKVIRVCTSTGGSYSRKVKCSR